MPKLSVFAQIHAEGEKLASEKLVGHSETQSEMSDCAESTTGSTGESDLDLRQFYLSD